GPIVCAWTAQDPTINNANTNDAGDYSVTVSIGGCSSAQGTTTVVINSAPATPAPTNTGPVCAGGNVTLNTANVPGANYAWTGPNGFSSTAQDPTINNANTNDAGDYSVTVT